MLYCVASESRANSSAEKASAFAMSPPIGRPLVMFAANPANASAAGPSRLLCRALLSEAAGPPGSAQAAGGLQFLRHRSQRGRIGLRELLADGVEDQVIDPLPLGIVGDVRFGTALPGRRIRRPAGCRWPGTRHGAAGIRGWRGPPRSVADDEERRPSGSIGRPSGPVTAELATGVRVSYRFASTWTVPSGSGTKATSRCPPTSAVRRRRAGQSRCRRRRKPG